VRAVIVVRLSRVTDATTSPERQLKTCRDLCRQRGYEVMGIAEDLDVSAGSTSPFDRPQLGDWLTNRLGEFDAHPHQSSGQIETLPQFAIARASCLRVGIDSATC
jgi:hypothetical protein